MNSVMGTRLRVRVHHMYAQQPKIQSAEARVNVPLEPRVHDLATEPRVEKPAITESHANPLTLTLSVSCN